MPGRQSIPSTGPRPHGSGRGRGGRGRGKGRGRSGRGRGTTNVEKSLQQQRQNAADCNQKQQCIACHKNTDRIKELQSKTTAGLLCLDEMTSVLDKLRIYLEDIQSDAALGLIENYENGAGGMHQQQPHMQQTPASNNTPQTLQEAINARPQYLTVPPSTYTSWLENELEITTLSDLSECINECINDVENGNNNIDILAKDNSNGHVWIKSGMRGAFRKYILRTSAEEKEQLGGAEVDEDKQADTRSRSPKCFLGSPSRQDVPQNLKEEIVEISNRLDVDSAEEVVRDELALKVNDKGRTSAKKTKLKKLSEGKEGLPAKEERDDCNNNGFKSINDEVRGLGKGIGVNNGGFDQPSGGGFDNSGFSEQSQQPTGFSGSTFGQSQRPQQPPLAFGSGFPTGFSTANTTPTSGFGQSNQVLEDSTIIHPKKVIGVEKGPSEEHVKRTTSPRGSASAICNLVGSMDNRSKKASAKATRSNSKSPTPDLQQTARVVSPKAKAVTVELTSPKGAACIPATSPSFDSKAQAATNVDNQKGLEKMTKSKGKIVGSLPPPPPTPPPLVTPLTPPKADKTPVEDKDKSSAEVTSPKVKPKAIEVELHAIKKEQKKKPNKPTPSHPFGKTQFARTNLSQFIKKSNPNSKKFVNPIFGLIQNEDTRDMGRRLIELEGMAYKQHKTISNLIRMKEDAIKAYSNDKVSKKDDVDQRQKEEGIIELGNKLAAAMLGKKNKKETAQRLMIEDTKHEMEMKEKRERMIANYDKQITDETKKLEAIQADLRKVKGPDLNGIAEDPDFHIDNNRDDRGHTYLMVASSNDDFDTAKICLDLGADPSMSIKNDEGLSAIHYSHFFGFDKITDLIMEVRSISNHLCKCTSAFQI